MIHNKCLRRGLIPAAVLGLILAGCPGSDSHAVMPDSGAPDSGLGQGGGDPRPVGDAGQDAGPDSAVDDGDSGSDGSTGTAAGQGGSSGVGAGRAGAGGFGAGQGGISGRIAAGQGGVSGGSMSAGSGGSVVAGTGVAGQGVSGGSVAGAGGSAGMVAGSGGSVVAPTIVPDQDLGSLDNVIWPTSEAFAYACYTRNGMQDDAICRAGYGLGPLSYQFDDAKIAAANESCVSDGGVVIYHACPTNSMLQGCFEHRRSPAYSYTCYYFGDANQGMPGLSMTTSPDLVYLNPNFTGR